MTTTPDFSKLYAQLKLRPDCSLEEFKHAYRRKVATLHPDRLGPVDSSSGGERITLADLMSLYGMAMQFQKDHGRLPGAPLPAKTVATPRRLRDVPPPAAAETTDAVEVGTPLRGRWLLLAGLLGLLAYLVISALPNTSTDSGTRPHPTAVTAATSGTPAAGSQEELRLGMDSATVLALQGTPSRTSEELWEYGPSWIRFEEGLVVGWYSSPLYRLRSSGQQAPGRARSER